MVRFAETLIASSKRIKNQLFDYNIEPIRSLDFAKPVSGGISAGLKIFQLITLTGPAGFNRAISKTQLKFFLSELSHQYIIFIPHPVKCSDSSMLQKGDNNRSEHSSPRCNLKITQDLSAKISPGFCSGAAFIYYFCSMTECVYARFYTKEATNARLQTKTTL